MWVYSRALLLFALVLLSQVAVAGPVVAINNTPIGTTGGSPLSDTTWKALLFTTPGTARMVTLELGLNCIDDPPACVYPKTANIGIALYTVVGGQPSRPVYSLPLQTVTMPTPERMYTFQLPNWQMEANTTYALVLKSDAGAISWGNVRPSKTPTALNGYAYLGFVVTENQGMTWVPPNSRVNALIMTVIPTFDLGGMVTGLRAGTTLTLLTNGGSPVVITQSGPYSLRVDEGPYQVTVGVQPPGQTCGVANGTGVASGNVSNMNVYCVDHQTPSVDLGGFLAGLQVASGLVLLNNGASPLTLNQTGVFSFPGGIPTGSSYNVTVGAQPPGQTCRVTNGSGVANNNVNNLEVRCVNNLYRIGGTVTGLTAGQRVRLVNNGVESLEVSTNGAFTFLQGAAWNGRYNVIVGTQPTNQTCTVTGGTGFSVRSNVTNIRVNCSGGTIAGGQTLPRSGLITAPRGSTTLYENMDYDTAPGRENTARIAIAALTNVRLTYPDFFNDRVSGKHELIGGLEVQGYARDYLATSHYGMVTLVQKTTGQTIAFQVTRPQPGPNNSGINVDFLDGSIGFTSHLTTPLPDYPNGRWTMWITRGGDGTEGWGSVPGIPLLPENPVDLGQVGNALNPTVNSQDIDWGAVQ